MSSAHNPICAPLRTPSLNTSGGRLADALVPVLDTRPAVSIGSVQRTARVRVVDGIADTFHSTRLRS
jgi:hypothetical protein